MQIHEPLIQDPLFVGLTRPASALGVPYGALVVEGVFIVLFFLLTNNPLNLFFVLPIHGILVLMSARDPGIFGCLWVWLQTTAKRRNIDIWGPVTSVAPVSAQRLSR
jgi:type IV secretion system protein VirB3